MNGPQVSSVVILIAQYRFTARNATEEFCFLMSDFHVTIKILFDEIARVAEMTNLKIKKKLQFGLKTFK